MFYYYGRKTKVVQYYPNPRYDTIIEPFAGSATYSLYLGNWKRNIILIEKYDKVYQVWKYLQGAEPKDILSLPDMDTGQNVDDFTFPSTGAKILYGYLIQTGVRNPKKTSSEWCGRQVLAGRRRRISCEVHKIRHWDIRLDDYRNAPDIEATWFIDPPYQVGGYVYNFGSKLIDYTELAEWCKSRRGQVIVCENTSATWMGFRPLKKMKGIRNNTIEAIWTNDPPEQPTLF